LADQTSLLTGRQLGRYQILSLIGVGGMGEVYRARDARLRRDVAIKVLPAQLTQDATALARFEREGQAVAALSHPNILAIHDVGTDQGIGYVVTELLDGESLSERLKRGPVPWREAVRITTAIANGLAAAHEKGIVHRDLKPGNVFLTSDGQVKILDFGLARRTTTSSALVQSASSDAVSVTESGVVVGTIGYMSPEQLCGEPADERSDIFSLGCVLFEMVTGQRAFARQTAAETIAAILSADQSPPRSASPNVPDALSRVIRRCLTRDASERFQSARDLVTDLDTVSSASDERQEKRWSRRLRAGAAAVLLLSLPVAGLSLYGRLSRGTAADEPIGSIAVLPLVNASGDPEAEYLSDGLTEDLINSLSRFSTLRVIARPTSFRYKGREVDPLKVGDELNVRAVLTGRMTLRGEELSIQADLIDVATGTQLWGDRFSSRMAGVFELEERIALQIVEGLRVRLPGAELQRLGKRYTENVEAYRLYLKGRREALRFNREGMTNAPGYFRQAIQLDSSYALAYAGLAEYHVIYDAGPRGAFAKDAALKALSLDERLSEAHTSLGVVNTIHEWEWETATREFQRAIALSPGSASARGWYGVHMTCLARLDEALAELRLAEQLSPLEAFLAENVGRVLYFSRRYDEAVHQFRKALDLDPNLWAAHLYLGQTYAQQGMHEEALAEFRKAIGPSSYGPDGRTWLAYGLAVAGRDGEARSLLQQLQPAERIPWSMAAVHSALGEKDQAFAWLEKAFDERFPVLCSVRLDPVFDSLRSDSRLASLLRRMRLEP
jgi:serine/threonine protein kinase/tetratricopeptide (TPR) repeat protein